MRNSSKRRPRPAIISDSNSSDDNSQDFVVNPGGQVLQVNSQATKIASLTDDDGDGEDGRNVNIDSPSSIIYETFSDKSISPIPKKSLKRIKTVTPKPRKLTRLSDLPSLASDKTPKSTKRRTRSSGTGIEYTPADLISSPSVKSSSDSDGLVEVKKKGKKTMNRVIDSDFTSDLNSDYGYGKDHQETDLNSKLLESESESDIPAPFRKEMLYCFVCGEDKAIDDFSTREQKHPRHEKGSFCLLHSWVLPYL